MLFYPIVILENTFLLQVTEIELQPFGQCYCVWRIAELVILVLMRSLFILYVFLLIKLI